MTELTTYTQTQLARLLGKTDRTVRNHTAIVERVFGVTATLKQGRNRVYTKFGAAMVALSIQGLLDEGVRPSEALINQVIEDLESDESDESDEEAIVGELIVYEPSTIVPLSDLSATTTDLSQLIQAQEKNLETAKTYHKQAIQLRLEAALLEEQLIIQLEKSERAALRAKAEREQAIEEQQSRTAKLKGLM